MRFKLIILSIFILLVSQSGTLAKKHPHHKLGISFSTISGTGLAYQIDLDRHNSFQFTLMPYYTGSDADKNLNLTIISGLEYRRTIYRDSENKIYGFAAASLWYFEKNEVEIINPNTDLEREISLYDKDVYHNLGVGVGYDYTLNQVVSFNFNLGLQYQSTTNDSYLNFLERTDGNSSFLGLGGGVGILFHL